MSRTILLVTVGSRRGSLLRWQIANGVTEFAAHLDAPRAGNTPARKDYDAKAYPSVATAHFQREDQRAADFNAAVVAKAIELSKPVGASTKATPVHILLVLDKVAMAEYDKDAKIYPQVAGAKVLADLRDIATEVIEVS